MNEKLRLPAFLFDSEMPDEGDSGSSRNNVDDADVAVSALVSSSVGVGMRASIDFAGGRASNRTIRRTPSASAIAHTCRLEVVRSRFKDVGISDRAIELLLGGSRDATAS